MKNGVNTIKKLMKPAEVAEMLSISKSTLYRMVDKREIRFVKVGNGLRFTLEDVQQYLDANCVESINE